MHLVAAPHLTIPVTQGRYSSGPVSSAAQAEDALVPALESPRETVLADPSPAVLPRVDFWSAWNEPNQPGWLMPQTTGRVPASPMDHVGPRAGTVVSGQA